MLSHIKRKKFQVEQSRAIAQELLDIFRARRSTRDFVSEKIDDEIIENAIRVAGTAPSGANKQPWHFVSVGDENIKSDLRLAAKKQELDFYINRPNQQWLKDLKHIHTNEDKEFLLHASHYICVFYRNTDEEGKNYYAKESTGLATGMLISALHLSGVSCLTYTPKNMNFMRESLNLPKDFKPFMMIVAGIPPENLEVPVLKQKSLDQISDFYF
ncbi:MAG: nitroreductase family protein [Halobacteriovoraceae bacterium]|nr:nitroreductase family protein [Halobacteriovoraceae bacterium]|tara:strand:- start:19453 stop:20094 length:642 start_codon:yes stop_codon:yes gene_type:complete